MSQLERTETDSSDRSTSARPAVSGSGDWLTSGQKVLETLSFRTAALPLSFVVGIITSRYLLPEGRGAYALGILTVTLGSTLLSIATAVTREIGRKVEPVEATIVRGLVLSVVVGTIGAAILFPVGAAFSGDRHRSAQLLVVTLPLLLMRQTIAGALLALGRLRLFNLLLFLDAALLLTGLLILVVGLGFGLPGAVAAWVLGAAMTTTVGLVGARDLWLPHARRRLEFSSPRARAILALGVKAGIVNLVALINYRVELFVLEAYHGLGQVGVYSLSISLAELIWLLSASLSTVALAPTVNFEEREAVSVVAQTVRHSLILTAVFGIGLGIVGVFAVPFIYGRPFAGAVGPLLLLIPGIVAFSPASVLSAYFSMRKGVMRYPMIVAGTSAVVNALLCIALIPELGARGAALASTSGYIAGSALLLVLFLRVARTRVGDLVPTVADLGAYRDLAFSLRSRLSR